jgi:hypothetical protein
LRDRRETKSAGVTLARKKTHMESERESITMSDEHLAIILRGIQARLEIALRQSSECLPQEERLTHMVHVADTCELHLLHLPCDDDTHWVERVAFHPIALDPVANLVDELTLEISHLTQASKTMLAPQQAPVKTSAKTTAKAKSATKRAGKKRG